MGFASQDEERGLKGIFGVVVVRQNAPTDLQHQRTWRFTKSAKARSSLLVMKRLTSTASLLSFPARGIASSPINRSRDFARAGMHYLEGDAKRMRSYTILPSSSQIGTKFLNADPLPVGLPEAVAGDPTIMGAFIARDECPH
jgi:hypothetical protein